MLSSVEKTYYQSMLRSIDAYRTTFIFQGAVETKAIERAYRALLHDNPQVFWLTGGGEFTISSRGNTVVKVEFRADLADGLRTDMVPRMAADLNAAVNAIVARARAKRTVYEQVLYVHDYIVDTTDYDLCAPMRYDAYGCLVLHRAVCAGYAKAFMMVMNKLGYVCGYAAGRGVFSGESHAWNYIRLDNEFYFIDVTWDDPTVTGERGLDNKTHQFFCLTTEELQRTHRLSAEYHVPHCTGTKYNYYTYNRFCLSRYSLAEVSRIAQPQLRQSGKFTVKFATAAETERAIQELIKGAKVYTIPGVARQILYSKSKSGLILTVENR